MTKIIERPERPKLGLLFGGTAARAAGRRAPAPVSVDQPPIVSETIG